MLRKICCGVVPVVLLAVYAAGCGASVNQAYKAEIDGRIAGLHPGSESYPSSDATQPMPLAVGQWVDMKMLDAKQRPGFLSYKIVGQEGDAFWIETTFLSYTGKMESRMLVNLGDRTDPKAIEVKSFTLRQNGKLQEYPSGLLGIMKSVWKPFVSGLIIRWVDLPRDDAAVPAGSFAGCYKRRATVTFGPYDQTSDSWEHPAVPINGLVRSVGVDKPTSIELVAFGMTGATSAF
jgi:hypothetical protein